MPIYEYTCTSCHHHFDILQKISETPVSQCPSCMQNTAIRLISPAGFQLKGSGWYATDFKNKDKPAPKKEKDTSTKGSTGKDPAPEKKAETVSATCKTGDK